MIILERSDEGKSHVLCMLIRPAACGIDLDRLIGNFGLVSNGSPVLW